LLDESDFDDISMSESEDSEMEESEADDADNGMPFPGLSPVSPSPLATQLKDPKVHFTYSHRLPPSKSFNSSPRFLNLTWSSHPTQSK